MAENDETAKPLQGLGQAELDLRRYEARLGVWKIVLGSFIVGLAGVLIPGVISFYNSHFENQRKASEMVQSQQAAHQQYIKDFFATAVNQDIELRIRFANYFENLSGPGQEDLWRRYLTDLEDQRKSNREKINTLERRLVDLLKIPADRRDAADFDRVNRELGWAYAEIGYVPIKRSEVPVSSDPPKAALKEKLYRETLDVVLKLASSAVAIGPNSNELFRFWELYKRDLIGVESQEFARAMIALGQALGDLVVNQQPPGDDFRKLAEDLDAIAQKELAAEARASAQ